MSTNSRSLRGKRVLVTRPEHQNAQIAHALRTAGAEPIIAPVIAIAAPDDPIAAAQAVNAAAENAWVVFTSANGVNAFFEHLNARREDARAFGKAKIAAIGIQTAGALRSHGIYPDLVPHTFIAEDLADALIAASEPGSKILVFRAQEAREVLPERLLAAGRRPVVVAGYKTVFTSDPNFAEKVARSDVLTFTSPSTVQGFAYNLAGAVAAANAAARKTVACIGPITEGAAKEMGMRVDVVATQFTAQGIIDALTTYFTGG
ncbi:MAG TPA: uroporphyrinogen-III synthase [Candidatus Baltobacteraceae bacterium]|jgi:uroporphyrinogen III methyltransferase/synthase|nr:uroporphyrinogen-III synthase [Candidatus Baltobacteraceae bacterium]